MEFEEITTPILIPLKLKYRVDGGFKGGRYRPRSGNSHGPKKQTIWSALQSKKK